MQLILNAYYVAQLLYEPCWTGIQQLIMYLCLGMSPMQDSHKPVSLPNNWKNAMQIVDLPIPVEY